MITKIKKRIYCDFEFWERFFELETTIIHNRQKRKLWDAFYDFLSSNCIFFNIGENEFNEDTPGGHSIEEMRRATGGAKFKFVNKKYPKFEELSNDNDYLLNSVFLTMLETSECECLSKKYGIMVFNLEMIFSAEHVYYDNEKAFTKENGSNWDYLMGLKQKCPSISCCNSLVIVDRYLLAENNKENVLSTNVKPILEALLPTKLDNDIVFTISIITDTYNKDNNIEVSNEYQRYVNTIKEIRPELTFSLNIFQSRKVHARSIFTNNIVLSSDAGFDVIGDNYEPLRLVNFTSVVFPFLVSNKTENNYLDWIDSVLIVKNSCNKYNRDFWGTNPAKHHLLDYYYEKPTPQKNPYSKMGKIDLKLTSISI